MLPKYYSFYLGYANEPANEWRFQDWKVAAYSPKDAILMDQFMKARCHPNFIKPFYNEIRNTYRKVVEFEKVRNKGLTNVTYRKLVEYPDSEIKKWFK